MLKKTPILILTVSILAGCVATSGTTNGEQAQILQAHQPAPVGDIADRLMGVNVPAGQALIYLYRPSAGAGSLKAWRFTVNGVEVADMANGTRFPVVIPAGRTTVQGRTLPNIGAAFVFGLFTLIPGDKANIAFDTKEGVVYFLKASPGFSGGPVLTHVDAAQALAAIQKLKAAEPPKPEQR